MIACSHKARKRLDEVLEASLPLWQGGWATGEAIHWAELDVKSVGGGWLSSPSGPRHIGSSQLLGILAANHPSHVLRWFRRDQKMTSSRHLPI